MGLKLPPKQSLRIVGPARMPVGLAKIVVANLLPSPLSHNLRGYGIDLAAGGRTRTFMDEMSRRTLPKRRWGRVGNKIARRD